MTVPAERIKGKREHRVPLSPQAMALLKKLREQQQVDDIFVFPGKPNHSLSNMSMLMLLRRMNVSHATVHGFRSCFRDWAAENTNATRDVAEMALAHVIPSKVEAAYRRGDLLSKRRLLMNQWSTYCSSIMPASLDQDCDGAHNIESDCKFAERGSNDEPRSNSDFQ